MTNQEIVAKLWNLCNILRDDGITYHQYVTELTYILFLKMAKETNAEESIASGVTFSEKDKRLREKINNCLLNTPGINWHLKRGTNSNIITIRC